MKQAPELHWDRYSRNRNSRSGISSILTRNSNIHREFSLYMLLYIKNLDLQITYLFYLNPIKSILLSLIARMQ